MFINKSNGRNNICGIGIAIRRKELKLSQRALADKLSSAGMTIDKNAIQRMEAGQRFITDIELIQLAAALGVPVSDLFNLSDSHKTNAL